MQTIWHLFRLQIDEKTNLFKKRNITKIFFSIFVFLAVVSVATVALFYVFTRLKMIGLYFDSNFFGFLVLVTTILSFVLGLASVFKNLFFNKDNQLLMTLPCSSNQLFISKIMVVFTFEFIANAMYTLPIFIAFGLTAGIATPVFFACLPLFLIVLPIFSLSLAAIVSIPIMAVVQLIKRSNIAVIVSILVASALVFAGYMLLVLSIASSLNFTGQQSDILINVNTFIQNIIANTWIFEVMANSILFVGGWAWQLPTFLGICLALTLLAIPLIKYFYFKLSMKNEEYTKYNVKAEKKYKENSSFFSLIKTEFKTIFRSGSNLFNYFIFILLMPFIVYAYDKLLLSVDVNSTGIAMIEASHILVLCILGMMSNVMSASAISREGGNFYLFKVTPINFKTIAYSKISFNSLFTLASLLLTMTISLIFTSLNPIFVVLSTLVVAILSLGHIFLSFVLDLKKPVLDWYDSSEIDKVSKNTRLCLILGLLLSAIVFTIAMLFVSVNSHLYLFIALLSFALIFATSCIWFSISHFNNYFKRIEV